MIRELQWRYWNWITAHVYRGFVETELTALSRNLNEDASKSRAESLGFEWEQAILRGGVLGQKKEARRMVSGISQMSPRD